MYKKLSNIIHIRKSFFLNTLGETPKYIKWRVTHLYIEIFWNDSERIKNAVENLLTVINNRSWFLPCFAYKPYTIKMDGVSILDRTVKICYIVYKEQTVVAGVAIILKANIKKDKVYVKVDSKKTIRRSQKRNQENPYTIIDNKNSGNR